MDKPEGIKKKKRKVTKDKLCIQCGKECGRSRLCRLRLAFKYISFLIDKELEKLGKVRSR